MGIAEIVPAHTFNFSRDDAVYWRKDTDDECPRISQIRGAGIFASSNCLPIPRRKACGPFIFRSFPNAMCAYFAITVHILPIFVYFSVYLAGTKNVSTNTIYSYRDTFVIFHGYLEKYCGFKLEKMLFNNLSRELILEFLQYLETERKCSISSRNQRLAALKSFAKYVQIECPDEMILCQRILSIDSKKAAKPTVQYLSNQQTDILMEQPDISTPKGRRDLAMIIGI